MDKEKTKYITYGTAFISANLVILILIMSLFGGAFHMEKQYDESGNVTSYTFGIIDTDERKTFWNRIIHNE